mmetsp:Transcript_86079/g.238513  ORF Transcript_86079/g.238513 Transcript_86079/m.238513 type:complete len:227 (+) Transcript_86079:682-1362(+)
MGGSQACDTRCRAAGAGPMRRWRRRHPRQPRDTGGDGTVDGLLPHGHDWVRRLHGPLQPLESHGHGGDSGDTRPEPRPWTPRQASQATVRHCLRVCVGWYWRWLQRCGGRCRRSQPLQRRAPEQRQRLTTQYRLRDASAAPTRALVPCGRCSRLRAHGDGSRSGSLCGGHRSVGQPAAERGLLAEAAAAAHRGADELRPERHVDGLQHARRPLRCEQPTLLRPRQR